MPDDSDNIRWNRRNALKAAVAGLVVSCQAADFWNKKQSSDWSAVEVAQLMARSPWAKEVNADFTNDADYKNPPAAGPGNGRSGTAAPPQIEIGREPRDVSAGAKRREPVTVRWESAEPIREAARIPLGADFKGRYVISVSGLPLGVMDRRRRAGTDEPEAGRMIEQLKSSATLEAKGQEPEQPGVVLPAPRAPGTYLFGFSKELLPLDADSREILFTLQTGMIAVKAKFDPKTMVYKGHLAL
jgi:hypothetical protein